VSDKNVFEYADKLEATEVADYLMSIAEGVKAKSLMLQGKGQSIALVPQDTMKLKVKAASKEGTGEIELELSWKEEYAVGSQKLEIGTGE